MAKLFTIDGFCFSNSSAMICVDTDKGQYFINKAKFEKWVDDRNKRKCDCGCGKLVDWIAYYSAYADEDIYDYLIIRAGSTIFDDIQKGIERCFN
jgi:hypothetical protein